MEKYDNKKIAEELRKTALNIAYYGNALYVAKDIPELNDMDRAVLFRYLEGTQRSTDHVELQFIAHKIETL